MLSSLLKPAFKAKDLPDLTGRVIVITGGTSGLGLASAIALASKHAQVIITARNDEKGQAAVDEIKRACGNEEARVSYGVLNLEDLQSVRKFATWFLRHDCPLHVLMLNASISSVPFELISGIESQFYVNHLAQYYLVTLLLDKIKQSQPSRIVIVSSEAHSVVKSDPNWETQYFEKYDGESATFYQYGVTKLANIMTAKYLAKQLKDENVWVNSLHPGAVFTENCNKAQAKSGTFYGRLHYNIARAFFASAEDGCLTQVYLAGHPDVEGKDYRGEYFVPTAKLSKPTSLALNEHRQTQLIEVSDRLISELE
jgi:NAD(P)-dependent dehydrogenase (short-subunit alcohol dehydrogenase family)